MDKRKQRKTGMYLVKRKLQYRLASQICITMEWQNGEDKILFLPVYLSY